MRSLHKETKMSFKTGDYRLLKVFADRVSLIWWHKRVIRLRLPVEYLWASVDSSTPALPQSRAGNSACLNYRRCCQGRCHIGTSVGVCGGRLQRCREKEIEEVSSVGEGRLSQSSFTILSSFHVRERRNTSCLHKVCLTWQKEVNFTQKVHRDLCD